MVTDSVDYSHVIEMGVQAFATKWANVRHVDFDALIYIEYDIALHQDRLYFYDSGCDFDHKVRF